jgi:membrane protein DedA with SNARE-associated domain
MLTSRFKVEQKSVSTTGTGRSTSLEVAIWLSAMILTVALGALVIMDAVDSWVVVVPGFMGVIVGLWRYRVETEQKKSSADDEGA